MNKINRRRIRQLTTLRYNPKRTCVDNSFFVVEILLLLRLGGRGPAKFAKKIKFEMCDIRITEKVKI